MSCSLLKFPVLIVVADVYEPFYAYMFQSFLSMRGKQVSSGLINIALRVNIEKAQRLA